MPLCVFDVLQGIPEIFNVDCISIFAQINDDRILSFIHPSSVCFHTGAQAISDYEILSL